MRITPAAAILVLITLLSASWRLPAAEFRLTPDVVFGTASGQELKLDVCLPATGAGPFPLVVWIHGGGWSGGARGDFAEGMRGLASQGFAGISVDYRLAQVARFPAQLDDLRAALVFIAANARRLMVDPQRVAVLGGSAGGHLALLLGFAPHPVAGLRIRAVVNFAGPTQLGLFQSDPEGDAQLKGVSGKDSRALLAALLGTADRSAAIYASASPLTYVRPGLPPVLTIHGRDDHIVPLAQGEALHAALRNAGVTETLICGTGGGHDFGAWPEAERTRALLALGVFLAQQVVATP